MSGGEALLKLLAFFVVFAAFAVLFNVAWAQEPAQRLRSPSTINGFVGGESHDTYVVQVRKGQTMTVRISWRREQDEDTTINNRAEFWISKSCCCGDRVSFGQTQEREKRWTAKIRETRDYYICVVAHPTAQYTLSVTAQ